MECCIHDTGSGLKIPFILNRNLLKANCTEDCVCTSCDTVVLGNDIICCDILFRIPGLSQGNLLSTSSLYVTCSKLCRLLVMWTPSKTSWSPVHWRYVGDENNRPLLQAKSNYFNSHWINELFFTFVAIVLYFRCYRSLLSLPFIVFEVSHWFYCSIKIMQVL